MLCICNNLGVLPGPFFPADAGAGYTPSPYLKLLQDHRADFTVLSGVSHPSVDGGHPSDIAFLTAAPHPASSSFRNSISLDQLVAERIGTLTRFPSLTLAVNGGRSLSHPRRFAARCAGRDRRELAQQEAAWLPLDLVPDLLLRGQHAARRDADGAVIEVGDRGVEGPLFPDRCAESMHGLQ